MSAKLSQQHRFLQKLALTPQMKQAIRILNLSTQDLHKFVDEIIQENPFVEKNKIKAKKSDYKAGVAPDDISFDRKAEENIRDRILSAVRSGDLNQEQIKIAEYMIYEIDDNGYISYDENEICEKFDCEKETIEKVIEAIQAQDPPGIGARDIRECLLIQLRRKSMEQSTEYSIVDGYLDLVAKNDVTTLAKQIDKDEDAITKALKTIKKLNPRPCADIFAKQTEYVVPDLISTVNQSKISLKLNRDWLPHLSLYNPYENNNEISDDPESQKFIKESFNDAKTLLYDLERRENTIYSIGKYIVGRQKKYLCGKIKDIEILTIKEISEKLKLHPSTVSRALNNKYIEINGKTISLSSLLSQPITKTNGETTSKLSVKRKISEIIKSEKPESPYTDEKIKDMLLKEGLSINRRTVAKYRTAMRILPTHLRRKKS
jgi:RNA polymerase sigma-54 factor